MSTDKITESEIEIFSLDEIKQLGFSYIHVPSIAPLSACLPAALRLRHGDAQADDAEAAQAFLIRRVLKQCLKPMLLV